MKELDQIKAIAELDGWTKHMSNRYGVEYWMRKDAVGELNLKDLPPYLISRDAIVPVIEKQREPTKVAICQEICDIMFSCNESRRWTHYDAVKILQATPHQLSEALLRATGKWKD